MYFKMQWILKYLLGQAVVSKYIGPSAARSITPWCGCSTVSCCRKVGVGCDTGTSGFDGSS